MDKTFALAFGKKKELKEQIAATDASLVALDEEEKKNNAELNQNEEEKTTSIAELDSGLRNLRKQKKLFQVLLLEALLLVRTSRESAQKRMHIARILRLLCLTTGLKRLATKHSLVARSFLSNCLLQ